MTPCTVSHGLLVRFFRREVHGLPRISQQGDVVLIRDIKVRDFSQQPMLLSNFQTSPLVFPSGSIPEPTYQISYHDKRRIDCLGVPQDKEKLSLEEQRYVIQLKHKMGAIIQSLAALPRPRSGPAAPLKRPGENLVATDPKKVKPTTQSSYGKKFRQVKDLRHMEFADICGQVVKKFPTRFGGCELYITDYTQNKDMFYYAPPEAENDIVKDGDEYGYSGPSKKTWPGPYGWHVLKVNAKEPHAYFANREVNEEDFVLLKNVKVKATGGNATLEGDMWPDNDNPEKVQISKEKNHEVPEIKSLLERKTRYWAARGLKIGANTKAKATKSEMKKQKKQRKAEGGRKAAQTLEATKLSTDDLQKSLTRRDINPYVRCGHKEVSISSVKEILDGENKRHSNAMPDGGIYVLPFVNAKYRARVRVVDFAPKRLEDFAVPDGEHDGEKSEHSAMIDWDSSPKYEWSFSLLLEDVPKSKGSNECANRIWVTLGHEEAQYLFGRNVNDPTDLRNDHQLLAKLREQLCILWGNLEEKADDAAISNRPFECCLMEYGVEMYDANCANGSNPYRFKRMYRMCGVTIL